MPAENKDSPEVLVEMLLHLGRQSYAEGTAATLSTAQWTALRYLDNANRFSRTPSAFARFHGTTRGTASQTIRGLIRQGLLTQTRATGDGRARQLELTDKAKAMRLSDPFDAVVRAAGDLPPAVRRQFGASLAQMLNHVAHEKGAQPFGTCTTCAHLECENADLQDGGAHACGITRYALDVEDLEKLCVNFTPAGPPAGAVAR